MRVPFLSLFLQFHFPFFLACYNFAGDFTRESGSSSFRASLSRRTLSPPSPLSLARTCPLAPPALLSLFPFPLALGRLPSCSSCSPLLASPSPALFPRASLPHHLPLSSHPLASLAFPLPTPAPSFHLCRWHHAPTAEGDTLESSTLQVTARAWRSSSRCR